MTNLALPAEQCGLELGPAPTLGSCLEWEEQRAQVMIRSEERATEKQEEADTVDELVLARTPGDNPEAETDQYESASLHNTDDARLGGEQGGINSSESTELLSLPRHHWISRSDNIMEAAQAHRRLIAAAEMLPEESRRRHEKLLKMVEEEAEEAHNRFVDTIRRERQCQALNHSDDALRQGHEQEPRGEEGPAGELQEETRKQVPELVHSVLSCSDPKIPAIDVLIDQIFDTQHTGVNENIVQTALSTLKALGGADAKIAVDLLDQGLCHTDPTNKTRHQRGLKLLRHLCAKNQIYPQAVVLRLQSLQQVGDTAEAFGGSSRVFRGKLDEKDVALKVVVSSREFGCDPRIVKRVLREAMIWRHLRHRNIATFHGVDVSLYPLCLVSEWVPLGTVSQYLFKNPRSNRTKLVRDIADGLAYLHALEIVHADLKAANVLVNKEHVASLIDFGIATLITDLGTSFTPTTPMTGTIRWAAPEVLDPEQFGLPDISRFTKASDIYSLSMTMWEVFTGHVPFHNFQNDGQVIRKITRGVRPARPPHSVTSTVGLTDSMWTLMESCWSEDCSRRPEITDVLSVVQGEDLSTDQGPLSWPLELDEYQSDENSEACSSQERSDEVEAISETVSNEVLDQDFRPILKRKAEDSPAGTLGPGATSSIPSSSSSKRVRMF